MFGYIIYLLMACWAIYCIVREAQAPLPHNIKTWSITSDVLFLASVVMLLLGILPVIAEILWLISLVMMIIFAVKYGGF